MRRHQDQGIRYDNDLPDRKRRTRGFAPDLSPVAFLADLTWGRVRQTSSVAPGASTRAASPAARIFSAHASGSVSMNGNVL